MQGGMKCRIVSAFAPLPLAVRNVGGCLLRSAGRCGHRPLRHQKRRFVYHCRGRCPRRPERNRNHPTDTPLADRKGIPKPWFRRAFGYFSRIGKVTRRRQTQPIQPPALFLCISHIKTQKFSANLSQIPIYITSLK